MSYPPQYQNLRIIYIFTLPTRKPKSQKNFFVCDFFEFVLWPKKKIDNSQKKNQGEMKKVS